VNEASLWTYYWDRETATQRHAERLAVGAE
jgi:hypothetical protein